MSAVSDIVLPALQAVGIRFYGSPARADETDTAIRELNGMLASWAVSWCSIFPYDAVANFANAGQFLTLGTDTSQIPAVPGDFPERPALITSAFVQQGGLSWEIPIRSYEEYRAVRFNGVASIPRAGFFKRGFPLDSLYLFPMLQSGYSVRVIGQKYFPTYSTIQDPVYLPPEYIEAAWPNLAARLQPMFGTQIDTHVLELAGKNLKHIRTQNALDGIRAQPNDMMGGPSQSWNYLSGWGF